MDFEAITSKIQNDFDREFSKVTKIEEQPFVMVGLAFLNNYLLNERILKLLRMLMIEQHINSEAAALLRRVLFENPIQQNEMVFEKMIISGYFKKQDAKALAVEYYAPIFFAFQRYFSSGDVTDKNRKEADGLITTHLLSFYRRYSNEQKEG